MCAIFCTLPNNADCSGLPVSGIAQAAIPDAQDTCAFDMPETDSLGISDAMSFGPFDADVLADASVSALAELDDKTGWLNIASLA